MFGHGNPVSHGAGAWGGFGSGVQGRAGAAGGCFHDHQAASLARRRRCHGSPDQSHPGIQSTRHFSVFFLCVANPRSRGSKRCQTFSFSSVHESLVIKRIVLHVCSDLQLDYVDLFLVHWPLQCRRGANYIAAKPGDITAIDCGKRWRAASMLG